MFSRKPLRCLRVHPGVRVPQAEDHWSTISKLRLRLWLYVAPGHVITRSPDSCQPLTVSLNIKAINVGCVVGKDATWRTFLQIIRFSPANYHSIMPPYLCIIRSCYNRPVWSRHCWPTLHYRTPKITLLQIPFPCYITQLLCYLSEFIFLKIYYKPALPLLILQSSQTNITYLECSLQLLLT
jgi:hypothetical protein